MREYVQKGSCEPNASIKFMSYSINIDMYCHAILRHSSYCRTHMTVTQAEILGNVEFTEHTHCLCHSKRQMPIVCETMPEEFMQRS